LLKEIIIAIQAYFRAHQFIKKHQLWKWILVPGIIYCLLFMSCMYFFGHTVNNFIEWLNLRTGLKAWLDTHERDSWLGFFFTMGTMVLWMVMMLFYFSLFKYFFLIVGSPVFAYLSEKTEAILNGRDCPFSFAQLTKDILRGIRIAARNATWQTVYLLALLFACVIPVAGLIVPIIALLIECYYYGFSMLDYNMERNKISAGESIYFIGDHKGLAIGNGMVFYLMHWVPVAGWILAPAYAIIAATLSMHPQKKGNNP
jgi:CysZ protein